MTELVSPEQSSGKWYIDLNWYRQRNKSIVEIAKCALCSECSAKLANLDHPVEFQEILNYIKECCSSDPRFIYEKQPVMESIFRVFLACGNQPLTIEEVGQKLKEKRNDNVSFSSPNFLLSMMKDDELYGLREVKD